MKLVTSPAETEMIPVTVRQELMRLLHNIHSCLSRSHIRHRLTATFRRRPLDRHHRSGCCIDLRLSVLASDDSLQQIRYAAREALCQWRGGSDHRLPFAAGTALSLQISPTFAGDCRIT